tara:strand:- start:9880 stop:10110 length:231 start_codon:yes stop_codon:yes gene_type:complete
MDPQNPQDDFETQDEQNPKVDHIYKYHKRYFSTDKGKRARRRAEKAYDKRNPEKRKKQKRDYMRRKREQDPDYGRF